MKAKIFYHASIAVAVGISFLVTKPVHAVTLVPVVNTDTLTRLDVSWQGTGLDNGLDDDFLGVPALVNWNIPLTKLNYLGGGNGWTGQVTVRHITDPHPNIGENGGGQTATLAIAFNQLGNTNASLSSTVSHDPIHFDEYRLTYTYTQATDTLNASLTGVHTPEPTSTLSFLALGILGAGATLKRKLK